MATKDIKRKLTAIFSADVKGYSRLMADDEEATVRTINAYREVMTGLIADHGGRVVDAKGDNVLAEFPSVVDAVRCAVDVQRELRLRNTELPEHRRMEFRIGVNLGDVIEEKETIYGDGVNVAARLEGLADPGGLCISGTAFDQVRYKLNLGYEYLGEQSVKNIPGPVRTYKVLMAPEHAGEVIGEVTQEPKRWLWAVAAIVLIVVAGGWATWHFYFRPPPIELASIERMAFPLPEKPSIAVLPFDNLSGDPKQTYLADGLTENIIGGLSKIPELFVIARHSTFTYKGKFVKVQQVAEDLGVRYVLEGSVQKSGESLRVTAQLIDALKGHHVWSEKYDRKMEDLFSVQDDISLNIAVAMQVELTEGEHALVRHSTNNLEAWSFAVKAHNLFETYRKDDNAKARELFKRSVELDPNYAYAWTYLGWTYWIDGRWYSMYYNREESFRQATEMAQKALSINDKSADAYALLSGVYLAQRKYDEAVAAGNKAIELGPSSSENYAIVAITMQNAGNGEAVISLIKQAMRLDPYYPPWYLFRLGIGYRMVGRYKESAKMLEKRIEIAEKMKKPVYPIYLELAATYSMMGRMEKAKALVAKALEINSKISAESYGKSFMYKDPAYGERILDALRKAGLPETPPLPLPDKPSIAVLPFVNMSGDPEQEYFSDGITEEIITALSKTPKLFVIARNSTFTYKGKPVKVQQVGRELGVKYVLEGSVRKSGDKVRITAQLVDAQTGHHLWAERYDRELKDIFAIQDEITMEIMEALQVELTGGFRAIARTRGTKNLQAYLKLLKGLEYLESQNKDANILARKMAEEVIALDPRYPEGYSLLAYTHYMDVWFGSSKSPKDSLSRAYELAQKAVGMNDSLVLPHILLGHIYLLERQHEKAIAETERAVTLSPNAASSYANLGRALIYAGQPEEAIPLLKKAIRLDPLPNYFFYYTLGFAYIMTGRYDEAVEICKKAIKDEPNSLYAHVVLATAYSLSGQKEEARAEAEEVLRIHPEFSLKYYGKRLPFKNPADGELKVEALRKAGLK